MRYHEPLFRPPSEADSLIFQIAYGCPHNTCLFCPMYKGVKYYIRPLEEVLKEIQKASKKYSHVRRIFLADGDVMALPYEHLEKIFECLNSTFPRLSRISMYSNGSSIISKTPEELRKLKKLKLFTLYLGLESGDNEILSLVHKNETAEEMTKAVRLAQDSGIRMSVMILLGLGGKVLSSKHADKTVNTINKMQPKFLAALRFVQAPGFNMYKSYETLSEYGIVEELYKIIDGLELNNTVFRANHSSNPIPIAARFPKEKKVLLRSLNNLLNNSNLDKKSSGHLPLWL